MIYKIEKLREYARGLDERLSNYDLCPDSYIDERIEDGIALAQDLKPIFSTTETYDISADLQNGVTELEIILQREPHSVYQLSYSTNYFTATVMPNNHILIKALPNWQETKDMTFTIRYFFYPLIPFTELEMSVEMFKLVKAAIASNCYSYLSDEANEKSYYAKAQEIVSRGTFDTEKDLIDTPVDRLWRRSWV